MARFYFHLIDTFDAPDEEGVELSDSDAAERHALRCARELMSDDIRKGQLNLEPRIVVEDEQRRIVLQLPFHKAVVLEGLQSS